MADIFHDADCICEACAVKLSSLDWNKLQGDVDKLFRELERLSKRVESLEAKKEQ